MCFYTMLTQLQRMAGGSVCRCKRPVSENIIDRGLKAQICFSRPFVTLAFFSSLRYFTSNVYALPIL